MPGPAGPTGPAGAAGAQGPAGPQQQKVFQAGNATVIGVPSTWTLYSVSAFTLPWSGTWLVRVWGTVSGDPGTTFQITISTDGTNQWRDWTPIYIVGSGGGTNQLGYSEPFYFAAGAHNFGLWGWCSGGGGSLRSCGVEVSYFGP